MRSTEPRDGEPSVACELCGVLTRMVSTRRCDPCYELEVRVKERPKVALRILAGLGPDKLVELLGLRIHRP